MGEESKHRATKIETERERERDDVILSVFPCGGSTAC